MWAKKEPLTVFFLGIFRAELIENPAPYLIRLLCYASVVTIPYPVESLNF